MHKAYNVVGGQAIETQDPANIIKAWGIIQEVEAITAAMSSTGKPSKLGLNKVRDLRDRFNRLNPSTPSAQWAGLRATMEAAQREFNVTFCSLLKAFKEQAAERAALKAQALPLSLQSKKPKPQTPKTTEVNVDRDGLAAILASVQQLSLTMPWPELHPRLKQLRSSWCALFPPHIWLMPEGRRFRREFDGTIKQYLLRRLEAPLTDDDNPKRALGNLNATISLFNSLPFQNTSEEQTLKAAFVQAAADYRQAAIAFAKYKKESILARLKTLAETPLDEDGVEEVMRLQLSWGNTGGCMNGIFNKMEAAFQAVDRQLKKASQVIPA